MGNRLSKIVTRTGDAGTTGLGDGTRVGKDCLRIDCIGEIDELNSSIGVLLAETLPEAVRTEMAKGIPLGRPGNPEDVANAVAFFAAEQSSYLTGQVLCADGGMAM